MEGAERLAVKLVHSSPIKATMQTHAQKQSKSLSRTTAAATGRSKQHTASDNGAQILEERTKQGAMDL